MNPIKYIFARLFCVVALEKNKNLYSFYWLILPNWRYYIRFYHSKDDKRFGKYTNHYWKPNRIKLFKLNGYKNKLKNVKL